MRDIRFKAVHRGGKLDLRRHLLLAAWAADCAEHVLPLFSKKLPRDARPRRAIEAARAWSRGEITAGAARTAAIQAHAAARSAVDGAARAAARSAGHAAAVAHMGDHALGAALYAVKAIRETGCHENSSGADREIARQRTCLPRGIRALVLSRLETFSVMKGRRPRR